MFVYVGVLVCSLCWGLCFGVRSWCCVLVGVCVLVLVGVCVLVFVLVVLLCVIDLFSLVFWF